MADEKPDDPMTPAQAGAVQMHEVFVSLRGAGFTIEEAAAVIAAMIKAS